MALEVLSGSIEKLQSAHEDLSPEDRELAIFYLERIADLQAFFRVAQLALETVVGNENALDFEEITKIEIE